MCELCIRFETLRLFRPECCGQIMYGDHSLREPLPIVGPRIYDTHYCGRLMMAGLGSVRRELLRILLLASESLQSKEFGTYQTISHRL